MVLVLSGCASLPAYIPSPPAFAVGDGADTRLGRLAATSAPTDLPSLSGFRLLPEGETAFNARIALAARAQRSIDAQYYLIKNDDLGLQFLRELRDAAVRGVRVRLLVDDLYTAGEDDLLSGLAAYPNVEVRLFNPLPTRTGSVGWRMLLSAAEFKRINHRMHNKLFIVDNSFAISGGRNIAEEYFMHSGTANFVDLDVLSSGPIVREMSAAFDVYWNSVYVMPIDSVAAASPPMQAQRRFNELVRLAAPGIAERPRDVLNQTPVAQQLDSGTLTQLFAAAQVFADSPDKLAEAGSATRVPTVTERTLALFAAAHDDVKIASPYFIPGERGMAIIRSVGATQDNGRLTLLTNSLESTDVPLAYEGYAHYRLDMLKAGVRIYELGSTLDRASTRVGDFGKSLSELHAKVATIDHRTVFIGSMNFDARSSRLNTEMGLAIDSPELATTVTALSLRAISAAYRLRLSRNGEHIEWVETDAKGQQRVHLREPGEGWWLRFKLWLLSPFVIEGML
jgi:putative cardiolipin synthase